MILKMIEYNNSINFQINEKDHIGYRIFEFEKYKYFIFFTLKDDIFFNKEKLVKNQLCFQESEIYEGYGYHDSNGDYVDCSYNLIEEELFFNNHHLFKI
jgi:hypothetical protein